MDLPSFLAELKAAQEEFKQLERSLATAIFCKRVDQALDKLVQEAYRAEFEHLLVGILIVVGSFNDLLPQLIDGPLLTQLLDRLFRQCARVVLDIRWQQNDHRDSASQQSFRQSLSVCHQLVGPRGYRRFGLLPALMDNPWTHPVLSMVMGSEDDNEEGEGMTYIQAQDPEVLKLRVELMQQENCDEFALNLCTWCLKHPALAMDFSLRTSQLVLLHRLNNIDRLQEECQGVNLEDSVRLINNLQGKEEHRELCTMLAQTFLVQNWIKPSDDTKKELLRLWIRLQYQADQDQERFISSLWAVAKVSHSTQQLLLIIDAVREQCGDTFLQFCLDLCVFAINVDKGCWEKLKESNTSGPKELQARKRDMAQVCEKLSHIVAHVSPKVSFCCALTAFSMVPTEQSLQAVCTAHQRRIKPDGSGKARCCSNCATDIGECLKKNSYLGWDKTNHDVNMATLLEVERLCGTLRPVYLSSESDFSVLYSMCKQYLMKENGEAVKSALVRRRSVQLAPQTATAVSESTPVSVNAGSLTHHSGHISTPTMSGKVSAVVQQNRDLTYRGGIRAPMLNSDLNQGVESEQSPIAANSETVVKREEVEGTTPGQDVLRQLSTDMVQTLLNMIEVGQVSASHVSHVLSKEPSVSLQTLSSLIAQARENNTALNPPPFSHTIAQPSHTISQSPHTVPKTTHTISQTSRTIPQTTYTIPQTTCTIPQTSLTDPQLSHTTQPPSHTTQQPSRTTQQPSCTIPQAAQQQGLQQLQQISLPAVQQQQVQPVEQQMQQVRLQQQQQNKQLAQPLNAQEVPGGKVYVGALLQQYKPHSPQSEAAPQIVQTSHQQQQLARVMVPGNQSQTQAGLRHQQTSSLQQVSAPSQQQQTSASQQVIMQHKVGQPQVLDSRGSVPVQRNPQEHGKMSSQQPQLQHVASVSLPRSGSVTLPGSGSVTLPGSVTIPTLHLTSTGELQVTQPVHIMTFRQPLQSSAPGTQLVMQNSAQMLTHLSGGSIMSSQPQPRVLQLSSAAAVSFTPQLPKSKVQNLVSKAPCLSTVSKDAKIMNQLPAASSDITLGNRHYSINNLLFTGEQQNSALSISLPDKLPEISVDSVSDTLRALSSSSGLGVHTSRPSVQRSQNLGDQPVSAMQASAVLLKPLSQVTAKSLPQQQASNSGKMLASKTLTAAQHLQSSPAPVVSAVSSSQGTQNLMATLATFSMPAARVQTSEQALPSFSSLFSSSRSPLPVPKSELSIPVPSSPAATVSLPTISLAASVCQPATSLAAQNAPMKKKTLLGQIKGQKKEVGSKESLGETNKAGGGKKEKGTANKGEMMKLLKQAMSLNIHSNQQQVESTVTNLVHHPVHQLTPTSPTPSLFPQKSVCQTSPSAWMVDTPSVLPRPGNVQVSSKPDTCSAPPRYQPPASSHHAPVHDQFAGATAQLSVTACAPSESSSLSRIADVLLPVSSSPHQMSYSAQEQNGSGLYSSLEVVVSSGVKQEPYPQASYPISVSRDQQAKSMDVPTGAGLSGMQDAYTGSVHSSAVSSIVSNNREAVQAMSCSATHPSLTFSTTSLAVMEALKDSTMLYSGSNSSWTPVSSSAPPQICPAVTSSTWSVSVPSSAGESSADYTFSGDSVDSTPQSLSYSNSSHLSEPLAPMQNTVQVAASVAPPAVDPSTKSEMQLIQQKEAKPAPGSGPVCVNQYPAEGSAEEARSGSKAFATYRCLICSKAFMTLDALRVHVKHNCKPSSDQPQIPSNKVPTSIGGLETSTVFQCMRCFELCISEAGIRAHKQVCTKSPKIKPKPKSKSRAKPKQPKSEEEQATEARVLELLNKCLGENREKLLQENEAEKARKEAAKIKQAKRKKSTEGDASDTPKPKKVKNENSVSQDGSSSSDTPKSKKLKKENSVSEDSTSTSYAPKPKRVRKENSVSEAGSSSSMDVPVPAFGQERQLTPSVTTPVHNSTPSQLAAEPATNALQPSIGQSTKDKPKPKKKSYPKTKTATHRQAGSEASDSTATPIAGELGTLKKTTKAKKQASSISSSKKHPKADEPMEDEAKEEDGPPSPRFKQLSGSAGRSFFKCLNCGQTLCSIENFKDHWLECITKKPLPVLKPKRAAPAKEKKPKTESISGSERKTSSATYSSQASIDAIIQSVASGSYAVESHQQEQTSEYLAADPSLSDTNTWGEARLESCEMNHDGEVMGSFEALITQASIQLEAEERAARNEQPVVSHAGQTGFSFKQTFTDSVGLHMPQPDSVPVSYSVFSADLSYPQPGQSTQSALGLQNVQSQAEVVSQDAFVDAELQKVEHSSLNSESLRSIPASTYCTLSSYTTQSEVIPSENACSHNTHSQVLFSTEVMGEQSLHNTVWDTVGFPRGSSSQATEQALQNRVGVLSPSHTTVLQPDTIANTKKGESASGDMPHKVEPSTSSIPGDHTSRADSIKEVEMSGLEASLAGSSPTALAKSTTTRSRSKQQKKADKEKSQSTPDSARKESEKCLSMPHLATKDRDGLTMNSKISNNFATPKAVAETVKEAEGMPKTPEDIKEVRYCSMCNQTYSRHWVLLRHFAGMHAQAFIQMKNGQAILWCPFCHQSFSEKVLFRNHVTVHADTLRELFLEVQLPSAVASPSENVEQNGEGAGNSDTVHREKGTEEMEQMQKGNVTENMKQTHDQGDPMDVTENNFDQAVKHTVSESCIQISDCASESCKQISDRVSESCKQISDSVSESCKQVTDRVSESCKQISDRYVSVTVALLKNMPYQPSIQENKKKKKKKKKASSMIQPVFSSKKKKKRKKPNFIRQANLVEDKKEQQKPDSLAQPSIGDKTTSKKKEKSSLAICGSVGGGKTAPNKRKRSSRVSQVAADNKRSVVHTELVALAKYCKVCQRYFKRNWALMQHIARVHVHLYTLRKNKSMTKTYYCCSICSEQFSNKALYTAHSTQHQVLIIQHFNAMEVPQIAKNKVSVGFPGSDIKSETGERSESCQQNLMAGDKDLDIQGSVADVEIASDKMESLSAVVATSEAEVGSSSMCEAAAESCSTEAAEQAVQSAGELSKEAARSTTDTSEKAVESSSGNTQKAAESSGTNTSEKTVESSSSYKSDKTVGSSNVYASENTMESGSSTEASENAVESTSTDTSEKAAKATAKMSRNLAESASPKEEKEKMSPLPTDSSDGKSRAAAAATSRRTVLKRMAVPLKKKEGEGMHRAPRRGPSTERKAVADQSDNDQVFGGQAPFPGVSSVAQKAEHADTVPTTVSDSEKTESRQVDIVTNGETLSGNNSQKLLKSETTSAEPSTVSLPKSGSRSSSLRLKKKMSQRLKKKNMMSKKRDALRLRSMGVTKRRGQKVSRSAVKNAAIGHYCRVCDRLFCRNWVLAQHIASQHLHPYNLITKPKIPLAYFCHLCCKSFSPRSQFIYHISTHTSEVIEMFNSTDSLKEVGFGGRTYIITKDASEVPSPTKSVSKAKKDESRKKEHTEKAIRSASLTRFSHERSLSPLPRKSRSSDRISGFSTPDTTQLNFLQAHSSQEPSRANSRRRSVTPDDAKNGEKRSRKESFKTPVAKLNLGEKHDRTPVDTKGNQAGVAKSVKDKAKAGSILEKILPKSDQSSFEQKPARTRSKKARSECDKDSSKETLPEQRPAQSRSDKARSECVEDATNETLSELFQSSSGTKANPEISTTSEGKPDKNAEGKKTDLNYVSALSESANAKAEHLEADSSSSAVEVMQSTEAAGVDSETPSTVLDGPVIDQKGCSLDSGVSSKMSSSQAPSQQKPSFLDSFVDFVSARSLDVPLPSNKSKRRFLSGNSLPQPSHISRMRFHSGNQTLAENDSGKETSAKHSSSEHLVLQTSAQQTLPLPDIVKHPAASTIDENLGTCEIPSASNCSDSMQETFATTVKIELKSMEGLCANEGRGQEEHPADYHQPSEMSLSCEHLEDSTAQAENSSIVIKEEYQRCTCSPTVEFSADLATFSYHQSDSVTVPETQCTASTSEGTLPDVCRRKDELAKDNELISTEKCVSLQVDVNQSPIKEEVPVSELTGREEKATVLESVSSAANPLATLSGILNKVIDRAFHQEEEQSAVSSPTFILPSLLTELTTTMTITTTTASAIMQDSEEQPALQAAGHSCRSKVQSSQGDSTAESTGFSESILAEQGPQSAAEADTAVASFSDLQTGQLETESARWGSIAATAEDRFLTIKSEAGASAGSSQKNLSVSAIPNPSVTLVVELSVSSSNMENGELKSVVKKEPGLSSSVDSGDQNRDAEESVSVQSAVSHAAEESCVHSKSGLLKCACPEFWSSDGLESSSEMQGSSHESGKNLGADDETALISEKIAGDLSDTSNDVVNILVLSEDCETVFLKKEDVSEEEDRKDVCEEKDSVADHEEATELLEKSEIRTTVELCASSEAEGEESIETDDDLHTDSHSPPASPNPSANTHLVSLMSIDTANPSSENIAMQNTPSVTQTKPTVTQTILSVTQIIPSVTQTKPTVTQTLPSVTQTKPTVTQTLPSVSQTIPSVDMTVGNTAETAEELQEQIAAARAGPEKSQSLIEVTVGSAGTSCTSAKPRNRFSFSLEPEPDMDLPELCIEPDPQSKIIHSRAKFTEEKKTEFTSTNPTDKIIMKELRLGTGEVRLVPDNISYAARKDIVSTLVGEYEVTVKKLQSSKSTPAQKTYCTQVAVKMELIPEEVQLDPEQDSPVRKPMLGPKSLRKVHQPEPFVWDDGEEDRNKRARNERSRKAFQQQVSVAPFSWDMEEGRGRTRTEGGNSSIANRNNTTQSIQQDSASDAASLRGPHADSTLNRDCCKSINSTDQETESACDWGITHAKNSCGGEVQNNLLISKNSDQEAVSLPNSSVDKTGHEDGSDTQVTALNNRTALCKPDNSDTARSATLESSKADNSIDPPERVTRGRGRLQGRRLITRPRTLKTGSSDETAQKGLASSDSQTEPGRNRPLRKSQSFDLDNGKSVPKEADQSSGTSANKGQNKSGLNISTRSHQVTSKSGQKAVQRKHHAGFQGQNRSVLRSGLVRKSAASRNKPDIDSLLGAPAKGEGSPLQSSPSASHISDSKMLPIREKSADKKDIQQQTATKTPNNQESSKQAGIGVPSHSTVEAKALRSRDISPEKVVPHQNMVTELSESESQRRGGKPRLRNSSSSSNQGSREKNSNENARTTPSGYSEQSRKRTAGKSSSAEQSLSAMVKRRRQATTWHKAVTKPAKKRQPLSLPVPQYEIIRVEPVRGGAATDQRRTRSSNRDSESSPRTVHTRVSLSATKPALNSSSTRKTSPGQKWSIKRNIAPVNVRNRSGDQRFPFSFKRTRRKTDTR